MSGSFATYGSLFLAIICEVIGTSSLKASAEFTRLGPTALMAVSYLCSFYLLAVVMRTVPVGIAYAVWSGLGIVLVSAIGPVFFQTASRPARLYRTRVDRRGRDRREPVFQVGHALNHCYWRTACRTLATTYKKRSIP